jgi:hypothetical protein
MKKEGPLQRKKLDGGSHTEVHPEGRMKDMLMCFNVGDGRWLGVLQPHGHPFCHWRCRMALTVCRWTLTSSNDQVHIGSFRWYVSARKFRVTGTVTNKSNIWMKPNFRFGGCCWENNYLNIECKKDGWYREYAWVNTFMCFPTICYYGDALLPIVMYNNYLNKSLVRLICSPLYHKYGRDAKDMHHIILCVFTGHMLLLCVYT